MVIAAGVGWLAHGRRGSLYTSGLLHGAARNLPPAAYRLARESVGAGYAVAGHVPAPHREVVVHAVQSAFMSGLHTGCLVGAGVCGLGALGAIYLPGRRSAVAEQRVEVAPATATASA